MTRAAGIVVIFNKRITSIVSVQDFIKEKQLTTNLAEVLHLEPIEALA